MNRAYRKHIIFTLLVIIFNTLYSQNYFKVQNNYNGFTVPTKAILPSTETHPSLYFHKENIPLLVKRREKSSYSQLIEEIKRDVNYYITLDASEQNYANRPRMAKTLAFWWIIEGDTMALQQSIHALLLAFKDIPSVANLPYDEIRRATWLQNYCAAYDWVYTELSSEQDSIIRDNISTQTQWLRENLIDGIRMAPGLHNHRSKPAWAIATAALTLSSHPQASDWLEFALKQQNEVTNYIFTDDGINREGGHYWAFCAVNYIPFLYHYLNVSGVDLFPYYQPVFEWPVKIRMGQGWIPNYEDGFLQIIATHFVASQYIDTYSELSSYTSLGHILQWHYFTTNIHKKNYTGATEDVEWEIDEYILYDNTIEPIAPDVSPTIKIDGGQIVFRNRWMGGDGHRYLLFHGVAEAQYHNHPDQLSFMIEANDAYLIADAGYGEKGYQDAKRYSWYITPEAHNIITVDSFAAKDLIKDIAPVTPYFYESDFFGFAEKWAQFEHKRKLTQKRGICFISQSYWVVTDVLCGSNERSTFRSYLHGRGDFSIQENHATWITHDDKYGKEMKLDAYLFPRTSPVKVGDGTISLFYDESEEKYVYYEQEKKNAVFMQILVPNHPFQSPPTVEDKSTEEYLAVKVASHDTTDTFILQTYPIEKQIDQIKTDGLLVWTRQIVDEIKQFSVRGATFFKFANQVEMHCSSAATLAIQLTDSKMSIYATENSYTPDLMFILGENYQNISEVFINKKSVKFVWTGNAVLSLSNDMDMPANHNIESPLSINIFPNPLNASTSIEVNTENNDIYNITIYNQLGQEIRFFENKYFGDGINRIQWDGKNNNNQSVSSGIYFVVVRSQINKDTSTKKLILIR